MPALRCILRLDDYSAWPSEVSLRLLEMIRECGAAHTVGIIPNAVEAAGAGPSPAARPFDRDSPMTAPLLALCDEGLVEPALHGWDHTGHVLHDGTQSELVGLTADEQARRIVTGKSLLEETLGRPVRTFIPPFNSYDDVTLAACRQAGLSALSASFKTDICEKGITLLPATCTLKTVERTLQEHGAAGGTGSEPTFLVVMYHAYELRESGDQRAYFDLRRLRALFSALRGVGEGTLLTATQAVERFGSQLTAERFRKGYRYWTYLERRHESLRMRCTTFDAPTPHLYYPSGTYQALEERLASRDRSWPAWMLSSTGARLVSRWLRRRLPGVA